VPEGAIGAQGLSRDVTVVQIVAAGITIFYAAVSAIGCSYLKERGNALGPVEPGNLKRNGDVDRFGRLDLAPILVARAESSARDCKQGGQRCAGFVDET
jgi:hypothetical protein